MDRGELGELQGLLLRAVLRGEPLPGGHEPVRFPDLRFVLAGPEVLVLDENLARPPEVEDFPKPVRVVGGEDLRDERPDDDVTYLRFGPAEEADDIVRINLEARIRPREGRQALGLGGLQARFQRVGSSWQLAEPPEFFAM